MPEAFKEKLNINAIEYLATNIKTAYINFDELGFVAEASNRLDTLELKARSNQIKQALFSFLPNKFEEVSATFKQCLGEPAKADEIIFDAQPNGLAGWIMMPVIDYLAQFAVEHHPDKFHAGLELMHACTKRFSAEFAIRKFLLDRPEQTLAVLIKWCDDIDPHVRRLASEGTRPYLPWGVNLKLFAKRPELILPILEKLKDDESEYVRRSVANSLNDIAKDHPDLIAELAKKWWQPKNKPRQKLIKHACRTLLKNGHPGVLACFGYPPTSGLNISLSLSNTEVAIGESLSMQLTIHNQLTLSQNLLIDYVVFHQKANRQLTPKVFKWTSCGIHADEQKEWYKQHSFKIVTTRKYYIGLHRIDVLVNGRVEASADFQLV